MVKRNPFCATASSRKNPIKQERKDRMTMRSLLQTSPNLWIVSVLFLLLYSTLSFVHGDSNNNNNNNNYNNNNNNNNSTAYIERACLIYCQGPLLEAIQLAGIYPDSKTFVDMPMIYEPEETLAAFQALTDPTDKTILQDFLQSYFLEAGSDLEEWIPTDFNINPPFVQRMDNSYIYKNWTMSLNNLWKVLGRQVSKQVQEIPAKHSFLPRNYPMIVPGGRFRESYYWDSYWIIRGLLVCDMFQSARYILNNFFDDINNFQFIPNGGRIYYLDRSQPPLLSEMVMVYWYEWRNKFGSSSTDLLSFLKEAFNTLEKEYQWWMNPDNKHVLSFSKPTVKTLKKEEESDSAGEEEVYYLNRYHSNGTTPRPESYLEDYSHSLSSIRTEDKVTNFYQAVRSGAETGWDFSSRWIAADAMGNHANISFIDTHHIIPIELNAILFKMEKNMMIIATFLENNDRAEYYREAASRRQDAIQYWLWNEERYQWTDYNLTSMSQVERQPNEQTIASYLPLWAGITPPIQQPSSRSTTAPSDPNGGGDLATTAAEKIVDSLKNSGLLQAAGVLTTTLSTGQQWDAPNAWPPLVLMIIEGLKNLNTLSSRSLALVTAQRWLYTCYRAFNETGYMYEKYNAYVVGEGGGGGEYVPQVGFGWSNAVALVLINATYVEGPIVPQTEDDDDDASLPIDDALSTALIVIAPLFLISAVIIGAYWYYRHFYEKKKEVYLAVRLDEENGSYGSNNKTLITPLKQAMATGY